MAFWKEEKKETIAFINDEAIEKLRKSFEIIAGSYKKELERLPSKEEIELLIQYALSAEVNHFIDIAGDQKIATSQLRFRKKIKKDFFSSGMLYAIPLSEQAGYFYGEIKLNTKEGVYIDYYDLITESIISLSNFKENNPKGLVTIFTGATSITSGEWKPVGRIIREPDSYQIPNFSGKFMDRIYISYGSPTDPDNRKYVEKSEAIKVRNPDGLFGSGAAVFYVEQLLSDIEYRHF